MTLTCTKCKAAYPNQISLPKVFPDIPGLLERVEPGDILPFGECSCGGFILPQEDEPSAVCNICGDEVRLTDIREHLICHNPNAKSMIWQDIRAVFATE